MNTITPQSCSTARTFAQLLSSTRRGARLARLLAAAQLRSWEVSPGVTERAEQIVAELAANAALHGRVPADHETSLDAESGRGLVLVTALADRWGVEPYSPGGKTVWAELRLPA